eukprot:gnl/TRDRNA2_/TRDRNA2_175499_c1_seq5.p1 gnl/TRDRNA2_/TRDRNA2_175499_c1~~gnl/TRDRNA2_/TRDRNA2_175499_c1_seq5.p1  ORF type:complete len:491 (+),score=66.75 gnl/TRDRNA2_/TRDRNA2_175499_c1_seq5:140-1612(+)
MSAIFLLVYCSLACLLAHAQNQTAGSGTAKGGEVPVAREAERGGGFVGRTDRDEDGNREQRESEMEACAICLDNLLEDVDVLACGHRFHRRCTALLLAELIRRCPLCRSKSSLQITAFVTADLIKAWLEVSQEVWESDTTNPLFRALRAGNRTAFYQEEVMQSLFGILRDGSQQAQEHAAQCFYGLLSPRDESQEEVRQMIRPMRDAGVIPALIRVLHEGSQRAKELAIECMKLLTIGLSIGEMRDAGVTPALIRVLHEGSNRAQQSAAWLLGEEEFHPVIDNETIREITRALIQKLKEADTDCIQQYQFFYFAVMKLLDNIQNHKVICEEGGVRALVTANRRAGFFGDSGAALALLELSENEQNSEMLHKEGGTRALRMMYFEDFPAIIYGCVFWSIAGLFTQISAGIEIILGRLKQVRQALSRRSRTSQSESSTGPSGTEASLHVVQLRKPHLHMVTIAGGAGVFNAALIFCHWGRSMREVEQPLLVV